MSVTVALIILEMNSPSSSQLWIPTPGQAFVPGTVFINGRDDLIDGLLQSGLWASVWHTNLRARTHTHAHMPQPWDDLGRGPREHPLAWAVLYANEEASITQ